MAIHGTIGLDCTVQPNPNLTFELIIATLVTPALGMFTSIFVFLIFSTFFSELFNRQTDAWMDAQATTAMWIIRMAA